MANKGQFKSKDHKKAGGSVKKVKTEAVEPKKGKRGGIKGKKNSHRVVAKVINLAQAIEKGKRTRARNAKLNQSRYGRGLD